MKTLVNPMPTTDIPSLSQQDTTKINASLPLAEDYKETITNAENRSVWQMAAQWQGASP